MGSSATRWPPARSLPGRRGTSARMRIRLAYARSRTPFGRLGEPRDVAQAVAFLASDNAKLHQWRQPGWSARRLMAYSRGAPRHPAVRHPAACFISARGRYSGLAVGQRLAFRWLDRPGLLVLKLPGPGYPGESQNAQLCSAAKLVRPAAGAGPQRDHPLATLSANAATAARRTRTGIPAWRSSSSTPAWPRGRRRRDW